MHQRLRKVHEVRIDAILRLISLLLLSAFCFLSCADSDVSPTIRFMSGDSLAWAQPDYDDSHWLRQNEDPALIGNYLWVRGYVPLKDVRGKDHNRLGLWMAITAPAELYWNGRFIGRNTVDGKEIEEDDAYTHQTYALPETEESDTALLAVRIYCKTYPPAILDFKLDEYDTVLSTSRNVELDQLVFAIIYFVIAFFYIFYYAGGESGPSSPIFIALLLLVAFSTLANFVFTFYQWRLTPFFAILICDILIMYAISLVSMAFFMYHFDYPKKWHLIPWAILCLGVALLNPGEYSLVMATIGCFIMSLWAALMRRKDSLSALLGTTVLLSAGIIDLGKGSGYSDFGFLTLILALNISLLLQIRQRRRDHQASLLRSARLEAQLLRKSIQPHYVLNSMNAVMDWIETEPEKGIEFLGALAEEFQVLSRISHKKEISVSEEIKICEAHLKIMSCRKEIEYSLSTSNIFSDEKIPPAIFHTLIENGVKYGGINGGGVDFKLDREQLKDGRRYKIFNSGKANKPAVDKPDGTGMLYIKSRLEESYGENWKLEGHYRDDGYECIIDIYDGETVS